MEKGYPLLIVFYLDREMMMNPEIMVPFAESVNKALHLREANAMAFFIPTDGVERVECINPIQVEATDMEKINKIVEDISKQFDVGQGADDGKDLPENIIEINLEGDDEEKPCECGRDKNGECLC